MGLDFSKIKDAAKSLASEVKVLAGEVVDVAEEKIGKCRREEEQGSTDWKGVALEIASMHAENLSEAEMSACSKVRREKFQEKINISLKLISGELKASDLDVRDVEKSLEAASLKIGNLE